MKTDLQARVLVCCLAGMMFLPQAEASTVSSSPQGCVKLTVSGRSDTFISTPLLQPASGIGAIIGSTANTVSFDGASFTAGEFAPVSGGEGLVYYAEFVSGHLEGARYKILGNSEDTLTLDTGSESLTAHALGALTVGDVIRIRSCWTVGQIFGSSDDSISLNGFAQLPTPAQADTSDSLLFTDNETPGITKLTTLRLFYLQANGWRTLGDSATDYGAEPLPPGRVVRVRRHSTDAVELFLLGRASTTRSVIRLPAGDADHGNDIYFGLISSGPVFLSQSGLASATSSESLVRVSPDLTQREDELLVWNGRKGFDRSPERTFFYLDGQGWRELGNDSATIGDEFLLEPGKGYLLRKRTSDQLRYWLATPDY